jgi:Ca-activated chloride channel family protein
MDQTAMMQFAWPWLLLLWPLPWLSRRWLPPAARAASAALWVPFYRELLHLSGRETATGQARPRQWAWFWLAWSLLLIAASRPQWLGEPLSLPVSGRDLMLAVDLSGSMKIDDMRLNNQAVDRLAMLKQVLGEFIARREGDRLGLILFGERAYLQTPLTFDRATVQAMLDEAVIGLAGDATAIGDAIGLAIKRLRERPAQNRVLILLTDGANTAGEVEPLKAAELAAQAGVKIHAIGVGAEEMLVRGVFGAQRVNPSRDLDEKTLRGIADLTGGRYFRARDSEELEEIYRLLDQLEPVQVEEAVFRPQRELFPWPLALALWLSMVVAWGRRA